MKRSGLFIGIEEGEITAQLPVDLPSGRVNSDPKAARGEMLSVFFFMLIFL